MATTPEITRRIRDFWRRSAQIFAQAERATKCIAHSDCHPKNLFPMGDGGANHFVVAIDWMYVGINMLGVDPALMLVSPFKWLELSAEEAKSMLVPVFEAYLAGVKESGWSGNEEQILMTYLITCGCEALRPFSFILELADNPTFRQRVINNLGCPLEEIVGRWQPMFVFGVDCIDEATRLSRKL